MFEDRKDVGIITLEYGCNRMINFLLIISRKGTFSMEHQMIYKRCILFVWSVIYIMCTAKIISSLPPSLKNLK